MPRHVSASQFRSAMSRAQSQLRHAQSKLQRAAGELRRLGSECERQARQLRSQPSRRTMVTLEVEVRRVMYSGERALLIHAEEWNELHDQDHERLRGIAQQAGVELEVVDDDLAQF